MEFWHRVLESAAMLAVGIFLMYLDGDSLLKRKVGLGAFVGLVLIAGSVVRYFRLFGWSHWR
jgi:hypothetical protein